MEAEDTEPEGWTDFCSFGGEGENTEGVPWGGSLDEGSEAHGEVTDYFPNPPLAFEEGYTFLSLFDSDKNSIYRKMNLYYPFSCWREWQVASWLLHSGLSMGKINSFLSLEMVSILRTSRSLPCLKFRSI